MTPEKLLQLATQADAASLAEIIGYAKSEIGRLAAKSSANVDAFKAALRFAKKLHDDKNARAGMNGAIEGRYICDGYSAVAYNEPFQGLPEVTGTPMNVAQVFSGIHTDTEITIPTLAELKTELKQRKALASEPFHEHRLDQDGMTIRVNLEYLIRAIEMLGNKVTSVTVKRSDVLMTPIRLTAEIGEAIVLPMRPRS